MNSPVLLSCNWQDQVQADTALVSDASRKTWEMEVLIITQEENNEDFQ